MENGETSVQGCYISAFLLTRPQGWQVPVSQKPSAPSDTSSTTSPSSLIDYSRSLALPKLSFHALSYLSLNTLTHYFLLETQQNQLFKFPTFTMFAKSTILLALFAATAQVAVAAPPACLMAAVK